MRDLAERSRSAFRAVRADVADAAATLEGRLGGASSTEAHDAALARLADVARDAEATTATIHALISHVRTLRDEWLAEQRYTEASLAALTQQLATALGDE